MAPPLADPADVESALLRPLTATEQPYVADLIVKASALLRNAAPSIDTRLAQYEADPTNSAGIAREVVSSVVAEAVKRYLVNPEGFASESDGVGPFSHSVSYALRSEKTARGVLQITPDDLAVIFPTRKRPRAGTIRLRPGLAPRPVGRYGPPPTVEQTVDSEVTWRDGARTPDTPLFVPGMPADGLG